MARIVSNEEFEEVSGLEVPKDAEMIAQFGQQIMDHMALLSGEHRQAFIDKLEPEQLRLLNILEMPDLDDAAAVSEWLAR